MKIFIIVVILEYKIILLNKDWITSLKQEIFISMGYCAQCLNF